MNKVKAAWQEHKRRFEVRTPDGSITWAAFYHGYDAGYDAGKSDGLDKWPLACDLCDTCLGHILRAFFPKQEKEGLKIAGGVWPDCSVIGCPNKVCTWASETLCHPHEQEVVGEVEMQRRYDATHVRPWSEPSIPGTPNYRLREFQDIKENPDDR